MAQTAQCMVMVNWLLGALVIHSRGEKIKGTEFLKDCKE